MEGGGIEPLQPVLETGPIAQMTPPPKTQVETAGWFEKAGAGFEPARTWVNTSSACKADALRPASGHPAVSAER